ncbi:MAG: tRNA pseudouridine(13) synthase TruD [Candidatus Diapherotrites archaeon]
MTGINYYTTTTKSIGGKIKKRVSDFIVKEISVDGKVFDIICFNDNVVSQPKIFVPNNENNFSYLHLTLEKFNLDTHEAIRRLCRILRFSKKRVGYAGLKDRRAITSQRISLWKPDLKLLENFRSRYVALHSPEWSQNRVEIGSLKGNFFEITIREISLPEDELRQVVEECFRQMSFGVANYFGEQRFGGSREITHLVGKEFIKGNMESAVMLYLTSPSKEEPEIALARKNLLESRDFKRALREFPKKFRYERIILHHLVKYPRDFVGAFQKLPKHLAYLFTHAYQSYLFNLVINERIRAGFGLKPIEGDFLTDDVPLGPLFGFDLELAKGKAGEIEKKVLESEGITLEDFKVRSYPELSCKGARKKISVVPKDLKIIGICKDEFSEGKLKLKISFWLEKGNYATTILRELMKN